MRKKEYARLQTINGGQKITREETPEFLFQLENALLLALLEDGTLTQMQYRMALEKLKRQRRGQAKTGKEPI